MYYECQQSIPPVRSFDEVLADLEATRMRLEDLRPRVVEEGELRHIMIRIGYEYGQMEVADAESRWWRHCLATCLCQVAGCVVGGFTGHLLDFLFCMHFSM